MQGKTILDVALQMQKAARSDYRGESHTPVEPMDKLQADFKKQFGVDWSRDGDCH